MKEKEMLTISREVVRSIFGENQKNMSREDIDPKDKETMRTQNTLLYHLFGEKCL